MNTTKYVIKLRPYSDRLWTNKSPLITHLDVELTERCNNNCIHCSINLPQNDRDAQSRELSRAEWQRILKEAAELGVISIRFTGGEPLLREDFTELYLFTRKLGMKVILFTNARNVTPGLVDLLVRFPPLEKLEVSVYGLNRRSYEKVSRKPGSYREFRRGVDLLLQNKIPFLVKGALLPANKMEIDEFETWASTLPGMDQPPSFSMHFELRGRRDSKSKNRLIESLRISPQESLKVLSRHTQSYIQAMNQFCQKFMGPPGEKLFTCGAGIGGCVDAYGHYQPCLSLRAPEMSYDLKTGTLKDALTRFFPKLQNLDATNPDYLERCSRCFLRGLCQQCPAKSWSEH
ncbi:MAG: radical SAM protein, partial [Candidatus Aminicenantes bacterium]|nr:radical SAM protein [Candidatus Aminicenantes bacterium]